MAELAGKTLVCTSCGQRQRADLAQIVDADAARPKRKHPQDRPLRVQESQATPEIAEREIAMPTPKLKPKKDVANERGARRMLH